ncbi:chitobiase/beta-hexosaminidase C-terminal domain-containing protein [Luteolibacter sp. GHJ8]|uniref:Chitobiase/beta-hexosaminidase C-terminal domain-containing protein n=1 Tax=Luteolibacter rhizosphaerae TaxID=2989719 RepID=A0ABT3G4L9_9BACT|nr:chitobiase/beta-hexosaminidase C-terminal domain-containing protein [Luteolibacter rhizosphaerae]MCW1914802.1 chitobiase/beta-hexosaminidase C-terminal domain-containing protein [Luteolibacter rhizosphaerae]
MRIKACLSLLTLLALPFTGLAKPERIASYGPNGTHWPEKIPTPFMYDNTVANIVEVPCNWTAIRNAIQAVTNAQANSGTLILVAPGELAGNGSSSGSVPALESIGSVAWGQRVTVAPRDGYGSVKWKNGVRFLKVYGVCFAGFESIGTSGVKMQGCRRSALAWIKCTGHLGVYGTDGFVTEGIELAEVVQPDHYVVSDDSANFYTGGGGYTDFTLDGCYHAPRFFEYPYTGGKPHTDTVQFASTGGGNYSNVTLRDTAVFSANNCSIQTGNIDGLILDHSYIVSDEISKSRYPHLPGGATEGTKNAFNGSGKNFRALGGSMFYGGMALNDRDSSAPWVQVSNTTVNKYYGDLNKPQAGTWTVNEGNSIFMSAMPPYPTNSRLEEIWRNPGATTSVSRPVMIPPGGTYNAAQQVTMTCSTANATIYYTLDGSTPTTSSTRYTAPVPVSSNTTIRAFATASGSGLDPSGVQVSEYRIVNQVSTPVIAPDGGLFSSATPVTLTCPTPGASIYFTLDGSTPNTGSTLYTGSLTISSSATLKAIGIKAGAENSPVASASFAIGDSYVGSEAWANVTLPNQTGTFTISWNSIPDGNNIDGVTGVGPISVDGFEDLACIVRFWTTGFIEARNGSSYQAVTPLAYTAGVNYRFEMNINVATKRYSVTVTPAGQSPVTIATNYAFRSEQAGATFINHLALVSLKGSHIVSDVTLGNTPPPTAPTGLRVTSNP